MSTNIIFKIDAMDTTEETIITSKTTSVHQFFLYFQGGMYILNILDTQAGGVSLLFVAATEVIAIGWFYRADRLRLQVSQMIGYMPGLWWNICWRFITPVILVTIFIFHLYSWTGISYDKKPYPAWAEVIGWLIALASIGMIPAFAVINFCRAEGSTIKEVRHIDIAMIIR